METLTVLGTWDAAVANSVVHELARARGLHPTNMQNAHEAYAVIKEELDEFWAEVMKKSEARSKEKMAEELIQVAAMAIRAVTDLHLRYT